MSSVKNVEKITYDFGSKIQHLWSIKNIKTKFAWAHFVAKRDLLDLMSRMDWCRKTTEKKWHLRSYRVALHRGIPEPPIFLNSNLGYTHICKYIGRHACDLNRHSDTPHTTRNYIGSLRSQFKSAQTQMGMTRLKYSFTSVWTLLSNLPSWTKQICFKQDMATVMNPY